MPRIVSGLDPRVRLEAYLAGEQSQRQLQAQQQAAQQHQQEMQMRIMEGIAKHRNEQAKALADTNKRAQMGEVIAMQQQQAEARAAGKPFEQSALETMVGVGEHIDDPDARALWEKDFAVAVKEVEVEERKSAFKGLLDTATNDQLITPEERTQYEAREQSGEDLDQMGKELGAIRHKQAESAMAMEKSAKALQKARALLDTMPSEDNPDYDQALKVITTLEQSATAQADPNAGKVMLDLVQRLATKEKLRALKEDAAKEPRPLLGEWAGSWGGPMIGGPSGPDAVPGTHATLRGLAAGTLKPGPKKKGQVQGPPDLKTFTFQLLEESKDERDLALKLKAAGVPFTPEVQAIVRQAMDEKRAALGAAE